jgi:hypothetical protein
MRATAPAHVSRIGVVLVVWLHAGFLAACVLARATLQVATANQHVRIRAAVRTLPRLVRQIDVSRPERSHVFGLTGTAPAMRGRLAPSAAPCTPLLAWKRLRKAGSHGWQSPRSGELPADSTSFECSRWAHNPKVAGSNPAPATKIPSVIYGYSFPKTSESRVSGIGGKRHDHAATGLEKLAVPAGGIMNRDSAATVTVYLQAITIVLILILLGRSC